jgi:hypothetical protein
MVERFSQVYQPFSLLAGGALLMPSRAIDMLRLPLFMQ